MTDYMIKIIDEYKDNLIMFRDMIKNIESLDRGDMLIIINLKKVIAGQEKLIATQRKLKC